MTKQSSNERTALATPDMNGCDSSASPMSSRRRFLKASAVLAAGVTAAQALPEAAMAQGASDVELSRVLQQRRILLKGGVILTLDRGIGDFAQADVLIEDGKIREVRPTALGMIEMGTTGVVDVSQVNNTPEHSDALIRALQDSGIRAVFGYSDGKGPAAQYPQDISRLQRSYFNSRDQLLTLALGAPPDPKMFALAREVGVPIVVHVRNVLPQRNDGEKLLELSRAGLLRPGDEYIHCLHFPADTWHLIKDSGGHVSLSPPIEMTMGHGTPAIQDALDNGVRPSLSSDHAVTLSSDFFTLMRTTAIAQRYFVLQRGRNGEQNLPPLLTCRDVLEFATVEGARCANLDGKIGTLSPGKDADIVVLRADRLDVWPLNNAPGAVVNLMNPSHVETVLIAGKARKWRGGLVGVDAQRVRQLMQESRDAVLRRAGFEMNLLG
jgi:5-methylthioadenosine/S-adenosylhomocysteine deaminase